MEHERTKWTLLRKVGFLALIGLVVVLIAKTILIILALAFVGLVASVVFRPIILRRELIWLKTVSLWRKLREHLHSAIGLIRTGVGQQLGTQCQEGFRYVAGMRN